MMSSLVSVRVNDELLGAIRANAHFLNIQQADYVRQAIQRMNAETAKHIRTQKLRAASLLVRKDSMEVNGEFNDIEHDIED